MLTFGVIERSHETLDGWHLRWYYFFRDHAVHNRVLLDKHLHMYVDVSTHMRSKSISKTDNKNRHMSCIPLVVARHTAAVDSSPWSFSRWRETEPWSSRSWGLQIARWTTWSRWYQASQWPHVHHMPALQCTQSVRGWVDVYMIRLQSCGHGRISINYMLMYMSTVTREIER
jgi:hypothetical protein